VTTLTTDKHVAHRSDALVVDPVGIRHYAIIVDELPDLERFEKMELTLPFFVSLCDLCDAYDAATGWRDFFYPDARYVVEDIQHGFPTCARCSGA
jgi:hypothetical protein